MNNNDWTDKQDSGEIGDWPADKAPFTELWDDANRLMQERDALVDLLLEIYLARAIDSGCAPSSITARAIDQAMGEDGSDRQKIIARAFDRRRELSRLVCKQDAKIAELNRAILLSTLTDKERDQMEWRIACFQAVKSEIELLRDKGICGDC